MLPKYKDKYIYLDLMFPKYEDKAIYLDLILPEYKDEYQCWEVMLNA